MLDLQAQTYSQTYTNDNWNTWYTNEANRRWNEADRVDVWETQSDADVPTGVWREWRDDGVTSVINEDHF